MQVVVAPPPPEMPIIVSGGGMPPVEAIIGMIILGGLGIWGVTQLLVPIAKALAHRISGAGAAGDAALLDELGEVRHEMEGLRHELGALQDRMDFTERMLGQLREPARLQPPT